MTRIALVGVFMLGLTALLIYPPWGSDPARGLVESLEEMAQAIEANQTDCEAMANALTAPAARYEEAAGALADLDAAARESARKRYAARIDAARKGLSKAVKCAMNRRVRDTLVNRL